MLIIITTAICVITFIVIFKLTDSDLSIAGIAFSGIIFLIALVAWPITYYTIMGEMAEFHSIQQTINVSRQNNRSLENISLQMKIVRGNQWLASRKYWNDTIFDIYIPDEIKNLEPLL